MRQFTADEIQAQFEKLPQEVKDAITSVEVNGKIQAIAKKYSLMIDQTGELVDEIGLVMLGLSKSTDFVNNVSSRCSINRNAAQNIAQDVNTEIFSAIRTQMRQTDERARGDAIEPARLSGVSALERAGGFEIERHVGVPDYSGRTYGTSIQAEAYLKPKKINLLEEEPSAEQEQKKAPAPENLPGEKPIIGMTDAHTDALVDHLLGKVASAIQEKIAKREPGSDPYHEPIQ